MSTSYAQKLELLSRHVCDGVALSQLCGERGVTSADVFRWWSEMPEEERERLVRGSTDFQQTESDPACEIVAQSIADYRVLCEVRLAEAP
jgi:hypothetical protein